MLLLASGEDSVMQDYKDQNLKSAILTACVVVCIVIAIIINAFVN